jgi:DNA-binding transcriptional ArsR family regulator
MDVNSHQLKYLLGWLIAGSRGGSTRAKIIETVREAPQNANQLSTLFGTDYKTIRHHIEILEKNKIIASVGEGYARAYSLSPVMEDNYVLFEDIRKRMWKK